MDAQMRTWAEISLDALEHNYRTIRAHAGSGCRFAGVVKADAYGHGAVPVSSVLTDLGADYLIVACLQEALELRTAGIMTPILILGYTPARYAVTLAEQRLSQEVHSLEYARQLNEALEGTGKNLLVHLKLDTGMGRLGFRVDLSQELAQAVEACRLERLAVEGVFMHFSVSDSTAPGDVTYSRGQFDLFTKALEALAANGICPDIRHCCNSGGTQFYPEYHMDMVRPGIMLYGYAPEAEGAASLPVKPVMSVRSRIMQVREFPAGVDIGYGRTFTTGRPTKVAVVPIGYADGLFRGLSGKFSFLIGGTAAPQIGRICMDIAMADVTDIPNVFVGDTAVLIGSDGTLTRTAKDLADEIDTIPYEVLCGFHRRVPRVYTANGQTVEY